MKFNFFSFSIAVLLVAYTLFLSSSFTHKGTMTMPVSKPELRIKKQQAAAIKNARDFLYWYKDNLEKANSFPLLVKDSAGYCQLNRAACGDYLKFLRSSELLSTEYFGYQQVFFDDAAQRIKLDSITDNIPEGFDLDFVLATQEPEVVLNSIDKLRFRVSSATDSIMLIQVSLPSDPAVDYELEMYKNKYSWRIGYISTPNND